MNSNFYKWYDIVNKVRCYTYKTAYRFELTLIKHGFRIYNCTITGNIINLSYTKNKTSITISVHYRLYDQINNRYTTYSEYTLTRRK